jgi:hypothetical protein
MLVQQIYPTNPKLRNEIPLWLKFRAFEYVGFAGRYVNAGGDIDGVMASPPRMLATIYVPAPTMLTSGVANKLNSSPVKTIFDSFAGVLSSANKLVGGNSVFGGIEQGMNAAKNFADLFYSLGGYFLDIVPPDFNDNIYAGTNKRVFKFNLVLPCLTDEDSFAAFAIGRAFEALSVAYTGGSILTFKHPPMWGFGVGPGTGPFIDYTWLTDPQLCSLESVVVNRSAPDGGSYAVFTKYGLKPSVTTISLQFTEIEPIYRLNGTLNMISRSQAMAAITSTSGEGLFG